MDRLTNPYAPGAGTPPPELAGRAEILELGQIALHRTANRKPEQSIIMVGLRGVGKTVLLRRLHGAAQGLGARACFIEVREGKTLPELLAPPLRGILYHLSEIEGAKQLARSGLRALKAFLGGFKIKMQDLELSIEPEKGVADSGDLETDLPDLIEAVGVAAAAACLPIALFIDELQYFSEAEFSALIMSIHRTNQRSLPVILIGAGLPQVRGLAGNSKSYSERLFRFPEIGALSDDAARQAVVKPAEEADAGYTAEALEELLLATERYPYFLQQWAYEAWNVAHGPLIGATDVHEATKLAVQALDESFFRVRFDRCTPTERKYMRALAELGAGTHRSGTIADKLKIKPTSVAPIRSGLIRKGMIYAPSHGDTAFTVPLFDAYMRRAMPMATYAEEA